MSTDNLNVSDPKLTQNEKFDETDVKSKVVPIFELTNTIENSLDELQDKMDKNEKDFMAAMNTIEQKIKDIEQ